MKVLVLVLLLIGCSSMTRYTEVKRDQPDYQTPTAFSVDVIVLDDILLNKVCGRPEAIACSGWPNPFRAQIYVGKSFHDRKFAMSHEFDHVVFGPEHKQGKFDK